MRRTGTALMVLGLCLMLCAGGLLLGNRTQASQADEAAQTLLPELLVQVETVQAPREQTVPAAPVDTAMTEKEVGGLPCIGYLCIPALELGLPVMSGWDYERLKVAPCRYTGSAKSDDLVLLAHNYPRHFGGLKDLMPGDTVLFTDMEGVTFCYAVAQTEILGSGDTEAMTSGEYDLTLFTCTYGGRSRVTVRCQRAE